MCGIIGCVGTPSEKDKHLSFNILTNLIRETQRRGRHATGYFDVSIDKEIRTHKAPLKADEYIHTDEWKQICTGSRALIGHTRFTTQGPQSININNHPHISPCGNVGLVHNGVVYLYDQYKTKYDLISDCDSEIILKMILGENTVIDGINKVFKLLGPGGDFACELINHDPITKKTDFYFFRDDGRPGKLIDARQVCGQIFICSEDNIWKDAVTKAQAPASIRTLSPINLQPYVIYHIDDESLEIEEINVIKPVKTKRYISTGTYNYNSRNWGQNEDGYYNEYNGYYNPHRKPTQPTGPRNSIQSLSDYCSSEESVLDDEWHETVNEYGLPRFEYFPGSSKKKTNNNNDDEIDQLKQLYAGLVTNVNDRYDGWLEEAYEIGAIDQVTFLRIKNESVEVDWEETEQDEPDDDELSKYTL